MLSRTQCREGFKNRYLPISETIQILCALCVSVVNHLFVYVID